LAELSVDELGEGCGVSFIVDVPSLKPMRVLRSSFQLGRKGGRKRQMTESKIKSAKKLFPSGVPTRDIAGNPGSMPNTLQMDSCLDTP
jgi:hypothetical protein